MYLGFSKCSYCGEKLIYSPPPIYQERFWVNSYMRVACTNCNWNGLVFCKITTICA